jgi:CRISPR-associated protein Cas2
VPATEKALSGYRNVWLFTIFDLPVETREQRRAYAQFRKLLLRDGFCMLQYSVYVRYLPSEEAAEAHRRYVAGVVPDHGEVRVVSITDRQFERMEVYYGK